MNEPDAWDVVRAAQALLEKGYTVACLPPEQWVAVLGADPEAWSDVEQLVYAEHMRLALSVEPHYLRTKCLLAPVVGAIRLAGAGEHVPCAPAAERFLQKLVLSDIQSASTRNLDETTRLAQAPFKSSNNYQAWIALHALLRERVTEFTDDRPGSDAKIFLWEPPTSAELRTFVQSHSDFRRLGDLPQNRWGEVWDQSGLREWVIMDRGGRPRSPR